MSFRETIEFPGFYYKDEDSDSDDVSVSFVSPDEDSLIIKVEDKEYYFYGKEHISSFFLRLLEMWYPQSLQGSPNNE